MNAPQRSRSGEESKRTQFTRWWEKFGRETMEPSHAAWIAWLERDRLTESENVPPIEVCSALRWTMENLEASLSGKVIVNADEVIEHAKRVLEKWETK
jgi:hypothetical protein